MLEIALRIGVAAVLGAVVGAEREIDGQDAGLRTHILLASGAAIFGVISVAGFPDYADDAAVNFDPSRVASYVAPGVGFLGAGAILKNRHRVRGLTTAASLWVTAAIGLAAGIGLWAVAIAGALAALLSLLPLKPLRDALRRIGGSAPALIQVTVVDEERLTDVSRALRSEHEAGEIIVDIAEGGSPLLRAEIPRRRSAEILDALERHEHVRSVVLLSR